MKASASGVPRPMDPFASEPPNAWQILRSDIGVSVVISCGVAMSIALSGMLVGFATFGMLAAYQLRRHFGETFRINPRRSVVLVLLATSTGLLAVAVAAAWVALVASSLNWQSRAFQMALLGAPIVYGLVGWVLAPFMVLGVLSIDPSAPTGLRDRLTLALRVTAQIPWRQRVGAIVLSALFLFGPLLGAAYTGPSIVRVLLVLGVGVTFCGFPSVVSALLLSAYAKVRPHLDADEARSFRIPSGLIVYALLGTAVSVSGLLTAPRASVYQILLMTLWFGVALAFFAFVRAHRLSRLDAMREDAPPGRRAFEGTLILREGTARLSSGSLGFQVPPPVVARSGLANGAPATLIADFAGTRASFRESADQPWPDEATLHGGTMRDVIEARVERATWVAYGMLTIVCAVGGVLTLGVVR